MKTQLKHPKLVKSLQKAHSAERAASLAYIGHAASLHDPEAKAAIQQIEQNGQKLETKIIPFDEISVHKKPNLLHGH